MNELATIKQRYSIPVAWRDLDLPGEPKKVCRSPFPGEHRNGDVSPSFSIFDEGRRWKDFATGEGGDVFDLVAKARGCITAEAIRWVKDRLGLTRHPRQPDGGKKSKLPLLRLGTTDELRELADRRGFAVEALRLAEERGLLRFTALWGHAAWCVGDLRGELHEFRRLDGRKWEAYGRLAERKSHCLGSGKAWPIGTLEARAFPRIVMVEGAPDLLAAFHFMLLEGKAASVAPVAVLGASNHHLAPEALAHYAGKVVCIYPHADEAGRKASREWARALKAAGVARVSAFDLSELMLADGTEGKDLADVCRISADCFEAERKFREVMP